MDWITRPYTEEETPKLYWLVAILLGVKKDDGNPCPDIKPWRKPVNSLKDLLGRICNLNRALVFSPTVVQTGYSGLI